MLLATREQSFIRLVNSVPGAFLYKDILFSINGICFDRVIYKERSKHKQKRVPNFFELFCGAYGTRNRLAALLAKNSDPGSRGEYIQKKKKPCGFFLRCVRDSNP